MKRRKKAFTAVAMSILLLFPQTSRADIWGGDVAVLIQILANALQQLAQLQQILGTGSDTLSLMRDINRGLKDGLSVIQMINPRFNPGLYGDLNTADQVLSTIQDLYGRIPQTAETRLQAAQDRSASESISMNGTLFNFADDADSESQRITGRVNDSNPQGTAKLTAQSLAILIRVTTQVLRTNSMMLKMMGENMALQNRKEKLQSAQYRTQYDGLSNAFGGLPSTTNLKPLDKGGN